LVRQLDASTRELQWVVDAYTLTFAALVLAAGSLGDRYGRKGALLIGLAVFGGATTVGGLVDSPGALIAVRAVMGVGAAVIFPATLAIISNLYTERGERARAIGLWGAMTGLGGGTGADHRRLAVGALLVGQRSFTTRTSTPFPVAASWWLAWLC
jgi:MFS family permease